MENIGENIKFTRKEEEVQLKLNSKDSAALLSIFLTARGINFRFVHVYGIEDDQFYDSDSREEYIFSIKQDDWEILKHDICWEMEAI